MSIYKSFDDFTGSSLTLKTKNFWGTVYELTDGRDCYAQIRLQWLFGSTVYYNSHSTSLTSTNSPAWDFIVKNENEHVIVQSMVHVLQSKTNLKFNDGFEAVYSRPIYGVRYFTIADMDNVQLLDIDKQGFSGSNINFYKKPAEIPNFEALLFAAILCGLNSNER